MAETVFEHWDAKNTFTVSTDERHWKCVLAKLAEQHPDEVECVAVNRVGSVMYHVPASWLRLRPPAKRNMTEEEKQVLRDRINAIRNSL